MGEPTVGPFCVLLNLKGPAFFSFLLSFFFGGGRGGEGMGRGGGGGGGGGGEGGSLLFPSTILFGNGGCHICRGIFSHAASVPAVCAQSCFPCSRQGFNVFVCFIRFFVNLLKNNRHVVYI